MYGESRIEDLDVPEGVLDEDVERGLPPHNPLWASRECLGFNSSDV